MITHDVTDTSFPFQIAFYLILIVGSWMLLLFVRVTSMLFYTFQGYCKLRFNSFIGWDFQILMYIKVHHYHMLLNKRLNIFILNSGLAGCRFDLLCYSVRPPNCKSQLFVPNDSTSQYRGVSYLLNVFNFGVKSVENHIESIFCNSLFGCFLFGREDTFPLFLSKIWCRFYDFLTITVKVHMPYTSKTGCC